MWSEDYKLSKISPDKFDKKLGIFLKCINVKMSFNLGVSKRINACLFCCGGDYKTIFSQVILF